MDKGRQFQKNIYFCFIDCAKAFECVDHNKLENSERDGNTRPPDLPLEKHICKSGSILFKQVRTGHGTTDWFQKGKGVRQGCILSLCLFNLHAEHIMRNAGLDEAQAGIMKVKKENEKISLKLNIQKTNIMASGPITSWQIDGETMEKVRDYFEGLPNHCRWRLQP